MNGISSRLRRIVVAYAFTQLGRWFGYIAVAVAVYDHTHSAVATAGLFLSAQFLPALLVPVVVARVEDSSRSILTMLCVVEAAAALALAVLVSHFWLPGIICAVAIGGTATFAATALLRAAAARIGDSDWAPVTRRPDGDEVAALGARRANAALNSATTLSVMLGPPLAGVLVAVVGGTGALSLEAAVLLACAGILAGLHLGNSETTDASVIARLSDLARHLRHIPQLRALFFTQAAALTFLGAVEPAEVLYAKSSLHSTTGGYGLLMGSWGFGMIIGSVIFGRSVRRPLGPLLSGGALAGGLAYLGMAAAPSLALACVFSITGGVGNGMESASFISAVQQLSPKKLQARVMSALQAMFGLCPGVGLAIGGAVTALTSPREIFWIAGAAATALSLVFFRISIPAEAGDGPVSAPLQTQD